MWQKRRRLTRGHVSDAEVLSLGVDLIRAQLRQYDTSVEEDEQMLAWAEIMSKNKRHAIIVRLGEKRMLVSVMEKSVYLPFGTQTRSLWSHLIVPRGHIPQNANAARAGEAQG
jgi:hypothetical protein